MAITPAQVSELIRKRRAIYPNSYTGKPVTRETIEDILENANWAPTHRLTEPWRFKVLVSGALERLSKYLGEYYKSHTPKEEFSEVKFNKAKEKPLKSACVIAICMKRDAGEQVPEWEEIAAVACAVQNMWLTCSAFEIGCYWSTPEAAMNANEFLSLEEGERCLGLFYMGYHNMPDMPGKRKPIADKVEWITD